MVPEVKSQLVPVAHWRLVPEQVIERVPMTVCHLEHDVITIKVPRLVVKREPKVLIYKKAVMTVEEYPVTLYRPVVKRVPVVGPSPQFPSGQSEVPGELVVPASPPSLPGHREARRGEGPRRARGSREPVRSGHTQAAHARSASSGTRRGSDPGVCETAEGGRVTLAPNSRTGPPGPGQIGSFAFVGTDLLSLSWPVRPGKSRPIRLRRFSLGSPTADVAAICRGSGFQPDMRVPVRALLPARPAATGWKPVPRPGSPWRSAIRAKTALSWPGFASTSVACLPPPNPPPRRGEDLMTIPSPRRGGGSGWGAIQVLQNHVRSL